MEQIVKDRLEKLWKSKVFGMIIDFCRVFLVILLMVILWVLLKEIEAVKLLNYDVCKLCMNKTGATCFYPQRF